MALMKQSVLSKTILGSHMPNKKLDSYIQTLRKQTGETRSVREFVPIRRPLVPKDVQARIDEFRRIPSLWK